MSEKDIQEQIEYLDKVIHDLRGRISVLTIKYWALRKKVEDNEQFYKTANSNKAE